MYITAINDALRGNGIYNNAYTAAMTNPLLGNGNFSNTISPIGAQGRLNPFAVPGMGAGINYAPWQAQAALGSSFLPQQQLGFHNTGFPFVSGQTVLATNHLGQIIIDVFGPKLVTAYGVYPLASNTSSASSLGCVGLTPINTTALAPQTAFGV